MKTIELNAETFAAIVSDIDERTETLRQAELDAMDREEEAENRFTAAETDENWNELTAAIERTKSLRRTIESLEKLADGLYSASVALSDLSAINENELKNLGLI